MTYNISVYCGISHGEDDPLGLVVFKEEIQRNDGKKLSSCPVELVTTQCALSVQRVHQVQSVIIV